MRRGSPRCRDWYLVRQLENFQHGIRGTHRQDYYGWQMATMADSLKDERSINDVVAYINTLNLRTHGPGLQEEI